MSSDKIIYKLDGKTVKIDHERWDGRGDHLVRIEGSSKVYKSGSSGRVTLTLKGNYQVDNLVVVPNKFWELKIVQYKDEVQ